MMSATLFARRLAHRLGPVLGLVLLVTLFVGGAHHHADGPGHECVVCTAGHSPAVAADIGAPTGAPDIPERTCHAATPSAPRPALIGTASSRAPPRA